MTEQALAGMKVLDLSHGIAGPYCTRMLAGFGADVIKIERPGEGDPARRMGPFLNDEPGPERSGLFLYLNSNKRSITLHLKSSAGAKIFKDLVKDADVVVESFRPGAMECLGLDYQVLEKINPGLVMTSISNFGQTGPYRNYKSSHLIAWGMSGGRYAYCDPPGSRPVQGGGWLTHYISGLFGLIGTASALYQRNESGAGQYVDVSMLTSLMLASVYPAVMHSYRKQSLSTDELTPSEQVAYGYAITPIGILPCKDGHIGVNAITNAQWELICAFFGMPELFEDPEFQMKGWGMRERHLEDEAATPFSSQLMERERMELFLSATQWRIPFALVPTTDEILDSPQHNTRGYFEEVDHPVMGKVTMPGAPFKMKETPWQLKRPAPLLGEDNEEVYCERLGYAKDDLVRLREQGVI